MASKVHNGEMELQHYVSVNISSSDDTPNLIEDVREEKCHYPVPTKEEDHEAVTWTMDMAGCDQVKVYYEKITKSLIVSGIAAGQKTHSCNLSMAKGFELNRVKLIRIQREQKVETENRLVKLVIIKVGKGKMQRKKKTGSFMCWKGSN